MTGKNSLIFSLYGVTLNLPNFYMRFLTLHII